MKFFWKATFSRDDPTGRRIADSLRRASFRGVKAHVLIDGFGSKGLPKTMVDSIEAAGVQGAQISSKDITLDAAAKAVAAIAPQNRSRGFEGCICRGALIFARTWTWICPDLTVPRYDYAVSVEGPLAEEIRRFCLPRVVAGGTGPFASTDGSATMTRTLPSTGSEGFMQSAFVVRNNILHRRDIEEAYMQAIENATIRNHSGECLFFPGIEFPSWAFGCRQARGPGGVAVAGKAGSSAAAICLTCAAWQFPCRRNRNL